MAQGTAIQTSVPDDDELPPDDGIDLPLADQDDAELEARAIRMGWTPLAQFRGDPPKRCCRSPWR